MLTYSDAGIEPRASNILVTYSAAELRLQVQVLFFSFIYARIHLLLSSLLFGRGTLLGAGGPNYPDIARAGKAYSVGYQTQALHMQNMCPNIKAHP